MVKSTFISFSLHVLFIIIAYYGLPLSKINDPIDQPIDIVEDINIGSQTSLKLGNLDKKQPLKNKKIDSKNLTKKNIIPPPPPTPPGQKIIDKKNLELKKKKEVEKVAQLIKKKPKLKIKKIKESQPPVVVSKPEKKIKDQKMQLAKGILKTLTKSQPISEETKKEKQKKSNKDVLKKIRQIVGNSNVRVAKTEIRLSITDINKIQNHVKKFWKVSYGASEVKMIITLKINTNTDGTVNSVNFFDKSLYIKDKFYRATADAARRAVFDSSPLPLPKGKEKKFENFLFDFDTSFINSY